MTTPRIVRTGTFRAAGREVDIVGLDALCVALVATSDETEDARALAEARQVRVTIEPADAPPAHGSPIDYLAQAKRLIESGDLDAFCDGTGLPVSESTGAARILSLLNSAHLAILAERAKR
jgi:hypothetical protein